MPTARRTLMANEDFIVGLPFPDVLPNLALGDNIKRTRDWRENHDEAKAERQAWKLRVLSAWNLMGLPRPMPTPVLLHWIVEYPDGKRRDPDNIISALKPAIDGLVDSGVLPGDDCTVIRHYGISVMLRSPKPGMSLRLEAVRE